MGCGSGVFLGVFLDSFLGVFWTVTFLANLLLNVNILLTLDENLLEKNKVQGIENLDGTNMFKRV